MKRVTVYYRPSCAFSIGVVNFMFLRGADLELVNLDIHPELEKKLDERLGDEDLETPVVEAAGGKLYVAPKMSELKDLLEKWGLDDAVAPHARLKAVEG